LFGSPSAESFVVRWNKSYELILYNTGAIVFKYGDVKEDDDEDGGDLENRVPTSPNVFLRQ
jgi:hypothetical protein